MIAKNQIEVLFNTAVSRYDAMIRRMCRNYSSVSASSDDLYQEVMVALWVGLKTFKGYSSLSTWVYRVTINACISYLRRVDSASLYKTNLPEDIEETAPDFGNDEYACLQYLIGRLKPLDKALLLMWLDELSYSEIADVTGLLANVVGTRLSRIRGKLQQLWKQESKI